MDNFIKIIEKIKKQEYGYFRTEKAHDKEMLLVQLAEHTGFQRACDLIINEFREYEEKMLKLDQKITGIIKD